MKKKDKEPKSSSSSSSRLSGMMKAPARPWAPREQRPLQRAARSVQLCSRNQNNQNPAVPVARGPVGHWSPSGLRHPAPSASTDRQMDTHTHMQKNPDGSSLAPALISPCEMWVTSCPLCPQGHTTRCLSDPTQATAEKREIRSLPF